MNPIFEKLEERLSKEQPNSLCYAFIPGLVIPSNLEIGPSSVLLASPRTENESNEESRNLQVLSDQAGISGHTMTIRYGNPTCSSTLLTWSNKPCSNEKELLSIPITTLNLFFRSNRPLVYYGCAFVTRLPKGKPEAIFVPRFPRIELSAQTPKIVQRDGIDNFEALQIEVNKLWSAITTACELEIFFSTAIQLTSIADAKHDETDQLRTRIIEYSVALESLFLEQESELSLRFALRCATLLSESGKNLEAYDTARNIYKMRSLAVHSSRKGNRLTLDNAETARQFLYKCLIRYMALVNNNLMKKDILALLDQALLSDTSARKLYDYEPRLRQVPLVPFEPGYRPT